MREKDGGRRTLLKASGPASIGFAEVNWSADGSMVRLLFCDGRKPIFLGFDFLKTRTLSLHEILSILGPQIQGRYGLPPETDAATWACGPEGRLAYNSRRRQAR
jgi:hypothetical protein